MESKKRRGQKITSPMDLIYREPYRTVIEAIYLLDKETGEAEPKQILFVINSEATLSVKDVPEHPTKFIRNHIYNKKLYEKSTGEVRSIFQSRSVKTRFEVTRYNIRDYLNTLIRWDIIKKIERGRYKINDSFKKELIRKSNINIIDNYDLMEITDESREYTFYGLEQLFRELLATDSSDIEKYAPKGLPHLKGKDYVNSIKNKLSKVLDELKDVDYEIGMARTYLFMDYFLRKVLETKDTAVKDFFVKGGEELLDFNNLYLYEGSFYRTDKYKQIALYKEEYNNEEYKKILEDYLKLSEEQKNIVYNLIRDEWQRVNTKDERPRPLSVTDPKPFTFFYSDAPLSPSMLTVEGAINYSREFVISDEI